VLNFGTVSTPKPFLSGFFPGDHPDGGSHNYCFCGRYDRLFHAALIPDAVWFDSYVLESLWAVTDAFAAFVSNGTKINLC